ncbi:uncharacterized protein [Lolium perenne]|uniref:uncharacterized protein n=1 Tax=Lolium perenne TaxID=4522 RepID=UPI003A99798B
MIKDLLRIGSQFIGYREYANRAEEKLAEANERADALSRKLEQSEAARKKADLAASKAKTEADEAKAKAAGVEELQKKLKDATAALDEHKAAQASREEGILKRLKTQSRRTFVQTNQDFDLTNPVDDPVLDALSYLELHGSEIREGVSNANAIGISIEIGAAQGPDRVDGFFFMLGDGFVLVDEDDEGSRLLFLDFNLADEVADGFDGSRPDNKIQSSLFPTDSAN